MEERRIDTVALPRAPMLLPRAKRASGFPSQTHPAISMFASTTSVWSTIFEAWQPVTLITSSTVVAGTVQPLCYVFRIAHSGLSQHRYVFDRHPG